MKDGPLAVCEEEARAYRQMVERAIEGCGLARAQQVVRGVRFD